MYHQPFTDYSWRSNYTQVFMNLLELSEEENLVCNCN